MTLKIMMILKKNPKKIQTMNNKGFNGVFLVNKQETKAFIKTQVISKRKRVLEICFTLTKDTAICEVHKQPNQCVVFLPSEHVIINESYQNVKQIQKQLKDEFRV